MSDVKIPSGLTALPKSGTLPLDSEDVKDDDQQIQDAIANGDPGAIERLSGKWADYQIKSNNGDWNTSSKSTVETWANEFGYFLRNGSEQKETYTAALKNKAYIEWAKAQAEKNYAKANGVPYVPTSVENTTMTDKQIQELILDGKGENALDDVYSAKQAGFNTQPTWAESGTPGIYKLNGFGDQEFTEEQAVALNKKWSAATGLTPLANGQVVKLDAEGKDADGNNYSNLISFEPVILDAEGNKNKNSAQTQAEALKTQSEMLAGNPATAGLAGGSSASGSGGSSQEDDPMVFIGNDPDLQDIVGRVLANQAKAPQQTEATDEQKIAASNDLANTVANTPLSGVINGEG